MAKYTNGAPGMRGINLKDGSTVWVDVGETVDVNPKDIADIYDGIAEGKSAPAEDAA